MPATINGNLSLGGSTRNFNIQQGIVGNDMVINANISNGPSAAGLTTVNGGTIQLTGDNTYTGTTSIGVGAVSIDGVQPSSPIVVSSGAVLSGVGTAGAQSIQGGIVAPGEPASTDGILAGTCCV